MINYINDIRGIVPLWVLIAAAAAVLGLLILLAAVLILKRKFNIKLKRVTEHPDLAEKLILNRYSPERIARKSRAIEKFAKKYGPEIIQYTKIDDAWIKRLLEKHKEKDLKRVMKYAREKGIFSCFRVSMLSRKLSNILMQQLNTGEGFLSLRELALAGKGEDFDGEKALSVFKDKLDELREMTGYPEWQARYFAVKILLHDTAEKSMRAIWDSFKDSYPLIRKTIAIEFKTEEKERIYSELYNIILNDPSFEVRLAAWNRIRKDFKDRYKLEYETLKGSQLLHALEILEPSSKNDENIALKLLQNKKKEIRFYAAQFLGRSGALSRLFLETDMGDMELVERNLKLLKAAVEVNETAFLESIESTTNPASLYIASRILAETGPRELIAKLAGKVFELNEKSPKYLSIYETALKAIKERGTDSALKLMHSELKSKKNNRENISLIFKNIPERADFIFVDTLIYLLKNPDFKEYKSLHTAFHSLKIYTYIDKLLTIIHAGREKYPHRVRIEALKILGESGSADCLQIILESLPTLPPDEAKAFTEILYKFSGEDFNIKTAELLENVDSKIRAALITALPATGNKDFIKQIKSSMNDSDPDVRIACVWALADFGDYRSLNQTTDMLRDPVDRVREEAARVIGSFGQAEALAKIKSILLDKNEVSPVKESAIKGLARSSSIESINILIDAAAADGKLKKHISMGLSEKRDEKGIKKIIEHFKDADPELKDTIADAFKLMGEKVEKPLSELLKQDIASLHPYIVEILEKTGYIEAEIRKLANRDINVRKEAAYFLSLVGSVSAFRGIVLASRDPSREVRVEVVKALEKLETKGGKKILDALENDPDKKVRMYTAWAMERLRAKAL